MWKVPVDEFLACNLIETRGTEHLRTAEGEKIKVINAVISALTITEKLPD